MKKVLRLQKVSDKKGGKPTPKPLAYSYVYSKAHGDSGFGSRAHPRIP